MSRHVVVIRSGGLGDFVLTLPLLRALHAAGSCVRLATRPSYASLLDGADWVDEVRPVEGSGLGALLTEEGAPPAQLSAWLRGADVFSFWADARGIAARRALACGARSFRALPARPERPPHVVVQILRAAGLDDDAAVLNASTLAAHRRSPQPRERLWLHPGSGSSDKNAPVEGFAALARSWPGAVTVSLGEAELRDRPRYDAAFAGTRAEMLIAPPLSELRDRIAGEAALFVGNDTGPTHLAAALGVPTRAVYLRTDPRVWRPVGARVQVLNALPASVRVD